LSPSFQYHTSFISSNTMRLGGGFMYPTCRGGNILIAINFYLLKHSVKCTERGHHIRSVKTLMAILIITMTRNEFIHSFISIQPWMPGLVGTGAHSCDWYGSGTLHPGQVLGGSLPLLSPAFRRFHFSHQVPPSAMTQEILAAKGGTVGEKDVQ